MGGADDMPKKQDLVEKLCRKPSPKNFTMRELDLLMGKCNCKKFSGGRGSGIGYVHNGTSSVRQFDEPRPGNELYRYQINKTIEFLKEIGEL